MKVNLNKTSRLILIFAVIPAISFVSAYFVSSRWPEIFWLWAFLPLVVGFMIWGTNQKKN